MKKRKRIIYVLCLLVGLGCLGSFAWFTAQLTISSNLKIKTGTLSMVATGKDSWVLQNKGTTEVTNKEATNSFQNVKPSDSFVKTVTIKNTGTLKQKLSFTINKTLPTSIANNFIVEIADYGEVVLTPNQTKDITIKLTLKGAETPNTEQNKDIDFATIQNTNFIVVNAVQLKQ